MSLATASFVTVSVADCCACGSWALVFSNVSSADENEFSFVLSCPKEDICRSAASTFCYRALLVVVSCNKAFDQVGQIHS